MSAVFSSCQRYRYRLEREIASTGKIAAVIMVNPSTADAEANDATIRRVIGFGRIFGWSRVIVGNVFAYRAADIRELASASDPVGPENGNHLRAILEGVDLTLVAWGTASKLPLTLRNEWRKVAQLADELGAPLHCLGTARDGHPLHPLMLSYQSVMEVWQRP